MRIPLELPDRRSKSFDAVGFGLNMTDLLAVVAGFPTPGSKQPLRQLVVRSGGQAATAMTACSRLGWRARYIGRFGDDPYGVAARARLQADDVDVTAAMTVSGAANGVSLVLVDETTGDRTVLWTRDPRLAQDPNTVSDDAVSSGRVLLVDCHDTAASTTAATYARERGVPTVVDVEHVRPGIESLLGQIDIIITAEQFPEQLTGISGPGRALAEMYRTFRPTLACATLGAEGSLAVTSVGEIRTPGFSVSAIDTTGAGDAFRGGFIAGWLRDGIAADIEAVLRYANAVAALKCRALGGRDGLPTPGDVASLLHSAQ